MANIGAGETYTAYLVKKESVNLVDAFIKDNVASEEVFKPEYSQRFRYRFLSTNEMTFQPISSHLKGKFDGVIYTSETELRPRERDGIYFVDGLMDGKFLRVSRVLPQMQHGAFVINMKHPNILELQ
jgi:hypothetical protein